MPDDDILADSSPVKQESTETSKEANTEASAPQETEKTEGSEPKQDESAASEAKSESQQDESVSSPEEAKRSGRSNAETRIKQLTAQLNALKRQVQQVQQPAQQPMPALKEPKMPAIDQFETIDDYNKALAQYVKDVRDYEVHKDRAEREREAKEKAQKDEIDKTLQSFNKKADKFKTSNPDFNPQEAFEVIQANPTTLALIFDSDIGPEMVAYLAENPDEAERLRELPPIKCGKEFWKLEATLTDRIKGIKKPPSQVKPPGYVTGKAASPPVSKTAYDILYG